MRGITEWSPQSWQVKPLIQQPAWPDPAELEEVLAELASLPPLVTSWEVDALRMKLAEAARGEAFLLQGGDCAESFSACESTGIAARLKILLQMSLVLVHGSKKRVIRVGRFAGQYAKPRSEEWETRDGITLPTYRGDIINLPGFSERERAPNPRRMLLGYGRSALTLNFIRALIHGGFADLHHPEYWELGFADHSPLAEEYHRITREVGEALRFMENVLGERPGELGWVEFFTSHEGLLLAYEQAQTRRPPRRSRWYNLSTHFPWIGMRTADPDGAHIEYFRGIANPIALKVGPATTPEVLVRLLDTLDPSNEPGRLTLIHRFGCQRVGALLPRLVETVRRAGKTVLWCSDPMHGNTRVTAEGVKTRRFDDILKELECSFDVHRACGSWLGGVHVELTADHVTECTGGARGLVEADLSRAYRSQVDPRLNGEQALELAMLVARKMIAMG